MAGQFENPANPQAHRKTTGPEIWRDTEGKVDIFVAGIGTGGTVSGTGGYLKEQKPTVEVIGVEPADSPLLTEGKAALTGWMGIGANFVPGNYDASVCDRVMTVKTPDAYQAVRELAKSEGFLAGITSGRRYGRQPRRQSCRRIRANRLWCCCRTPASGISRPL